MNLRAFIVILCVLCPFIGRAALVRTNTVPFHPRAVILTIIAGSNDVIQSSTDLRNFTDVAGNPLVLTNPPGQIRTFRARSGKAHLTWNIADTNAGSITVLQYCDGRRGFYQETLLVTNTCDEWPLDATPQHFVVYQTDTNQPMPALSQFSNRADFTPTIPTISETATNFIPATNAP